MTAPFLQHQLVAPRRKLGTERLLLIFGRAPASELFAFRPARRLTSCPVKRGPERKFSVIPSTAPHPPPDLHPRRQLYRRAPWVRTGRPPRPHSPALASAPRRPWDARVPTCARGRTYASGTPQWINHLGHHLHSGYSLDCRNPSQRLALLNSGPGWTIIPGELPERAKQSSLYITGWCLHKSSHGIWQGACQRRSGPGSNAARAPCFKSFTAVWQPSKEAS